jgi:hypothetical protein
VDTRAILDPEDKHMDLTALLQWLAERGITALVKADAERMAEGRPPWTFVASGAALGEQLVRTDAATLAACLDHVLPRLAEHGIAVPYDLLTREKNQDTNH